MTAGRPKIQFDEKDIRVVEGLAAIGCTYDEIAATLGCSIDTVRDRIRDESTEFSKAYKKGASAVRISLRRHQINLAKKDNATMLVWLGKNMLGQSDHIGIGESEKLRPVESDIYEMINSVPKEPNNAKSD